jgi:hypothetical protein
MIPDGSRMCESGWMRRGVEVRLGPGDRNRLEAVIGLHKHVLSVTPSKPPEASTSSSLGREISRGSISVPDAQSPIYYCGGYHNRGNSQHSERGLSSCPRWTTSVLGATVTSVFLICSISIFSAVFLILKLDRSFERLIQISSAPLRQALSRLGQ